MALNADELLAGSSLTHEVTIPAELLGNDASNALIGNVMLRPLTVRDLQRIGKAVNGDDSLSAALMIQTAMTEPALKFDQVSQLPAGLARYLVDRINAISGIDASADMLKEYVQTPLAKACFVLAKEFGWTPEEVSGMTIGQILLYVEMARGQNAEQQE